MAGDEHHLHWADYVVTAFSLVVALGIGVFFAVYRGGQKTKEEYLVGNRQMGLVPVCLSLFVSYQSAISLMGSPADTYNTGTMVFFNYLGIGLSYVLGYFTVLPLVHPLQLTSVYHFLHLRFRSGVVRLLLTCIGMLQTILYMGIALYAPSLALQSAAGLPLWVSLILVGGIGTVYTAIGGIKSVVWTDAFQAVIVFIGVTAVLVKGILIVGGFKRVVDIAADGGRLIFDEVDPRERHSLWSTLIGGCFMWMVSFFSQTSVQRICSLPTLKDARRSFLLNVPLNLLYGSTLVLTGVVLYAYVVATGCDPYAAGFVTNRNQMMPYFVVHVLSDLPGMAGVYMAMLFSGALSTLSSGINALAANTVEDVLARPLKGRTDATVTVVAKCAVVVYGAIAVGLAYLIRNLSGPVTQMSNSVVGAFGAPTMGVFFLAASFPKCNEIGAGGGALTGFAVSVWLTISTRLYGTPTASLPPGPVNNCYDGMDTTGNTSTILYDQSTMAGTLSESSLLNSTAAPMEDRPYHFNIYDISYLWFAPIGFAVTWVSGMLISLFTGGQDPEAVDPRLIFPFCRKLFRLPDPDHHVKDQHDNLALWEVHLEHPLEQAAKLQ